MAVEGPDDDFENNCVKYVVPLRILYMLGIMAVMVVFLIVITFLIVGHERRLQRLEFKPLTQEQLENKKAINLKLRQIKMLQDQVKGLKE